MKESRKTKRARKLFEKRSEILLMPTGQDHTAISFYIGVLCRGFVGAAFVFGLTLLFADAMTIVEEIVPYTTLLWPSLIFGLVLTLMQLHKAALAAGIVLIPAGMYAWILFVLGQEPIHYIELAFKYFVNTVIDRVAFAGLAELKLYSFDPIYNLYDKAELMSLALSLFVLLVSVLVIPAVVKRVRFICLTVMGLLFLVPIASYNITRDNWGFSMAVIGYAAVLTLYIYDRKYLRTDTGRTVCADSGELSAAFAAADVTFEAENTPKPTRKKRSKGKDRDIESALRLETPAERRKRRSNERKAAKLAKREKKAKKRVEKRELKSKLPKKTEFEAAALGGPVGAFVFAVLFLIIWIPTVAVSESSETIPYVDRFIGRARMYVTAFLSGSEIDLNTSGTIGGTSSELRDVSIKYPEYDEVIVATVETPYNTPVYLRAWVGETYSDNKWTTAGVASVEKYRDRFGDYFTPESITENFYKAIDDSFYEFSEGSGYRNNLKHGYITERVNVTRKYGSGTLLYMPSQALPSLGIERYRIGGSSFLPNEAYYEGVWTSRYFIEGTQYSTVSNVASYRMPNIGEAFDNDIRYYNTSMNFIISRADEAIENGTAEMLVESHEALLESLGVTYSGESLGRRYCFEMTDDERAELKEAYLLEFEYAEFVKETYLQTDPADADRIKSGTYNVLQAYMRDYFHGQSLPSEFWSGTVRYEYYHDTVMALVKYLAENMTYALEPPEESAETDGLIDPEDYLSGISSSSVRGFFGGGPLMSSEDDVTALVRFLAYDKRGYCVQYASALTMMLRSIGIPARYCEGFIANEFTTDFHGNDDPLTRYRTDIYDSNAHAWVEVYYPSIGWVQYEATEVYLDGLYGSDMPEVDDVGDVGVTDKPDDPIEPDDIEPEEPITPEGETLGEKLARIAIIVGIVLAVAAVVACVILTVRFFKRAKRANEHRLALIMATSEGGKDYRDESMHGDASELISGIFAVYGALDLHPETGELSPEYASRLAESIGDASDITPEMTLEAISKEEFGHGVSRRELALLSQYYGDLTRSVYDGLGGLDRFRFRYVMRIV